MKAVLVAVNAKYIHTNLAIYSLVANAGDNQRFIEPVQYTINNKMDGIIRDLYGRRPDVLFFSCYVWNIEYIKDIAVELHKLMPDVDIWLGGPEVSFDCEEFLTGNSYIRGIICGEGEVVFKNLLDYYCSNKINKLSQIGSIVYRDGNEIIRTDYEKLLDLDEVNFVYSDLSEFDNKIIYYESSRGCPFGCSYCMSSIDKTVRFRSLPLVKKELEFFLANNVKQVKFIDRTFNINVARTKSILEYLKENDNGVTNFHFEVAADIITGEEIKLLKQMRPGYVQLEIGVQSTNPKTIEAINRKMDFAKVKEVVNKLIDGGNVHVHLDLIAGLPWEDIQSFENSFNDVYMLRPHQLQLGFLKVLKGAPMHSLAKEFDILYSDKAPYEVMSTRWLSFDDVISLKEVEEMLEVYYNSGLFANSLRFLESYFDGPFDMYRKLADYYKSNNFLSINHTRITRYNILLDFVKCMQIVDVNLFEKILLFDLYSRENLKSRPGFCGENNFYEYCSKERYREISRSYNKKNFHIEPFDIDILKLVDSKEVISKDVLVLFDYDNMHPVSKMAATIEV